MSNIKSTAALLFFFFVLDKKRKTSRLAAALRVTSRRDTSWEAGCRMYGRKPPLAVAPGRTDESDVSRVGPHALHSALFSTSHETFTTVSNYI